MIKIYVNELTLSYENAVCLSHRLKSTQLNKNKKNKKISTESWSLQIRLGCRKKIYETIDLKKYVLFCLLFNDKRKTDGVSF